MGSGFSGSVGPWAGRPRGVGASVRNTAKSLSSFRQTRFSRKDNDPYKLNKSQSAGDKEHVASQSRCLSMTPETRIPCQDLTALVADRPDLPGIKDRRSSGYPPRLETQCSAPYRSPLR